MKQKIYTDSLLMGEIKREVNRAFAQCKPIENILAEYGYKVTRENVTDCLTMRQEQVRGELLSDGLNGFSGALPKYAVSTKWVGCPHLEKELADKMENAIDGRYSPRRQHEELEALQSEFDVMLFRCNEQIHPTRGQILNLSYFVRWFDVEDGKIILSPQIEKLIEEEATIYCDSKKAEVAFDLHKQTAEMLTKFVALFPKDRQPDDVGDLFVIDGDEVVIRNINYNKYLA